MDREQFINILDSAKLYDLTQGCSIFTPPWPGEKALEIHFFKHGEECYRGRRIPKNTLSHFNRRNPQCYL